MDANLRKLLSVVIVVAALSSAAARACASDSSSSIEIRATELFNQGQYAQALPMMQDLEARLIKDSRCADKLATVQEQIRVCLTNIPARTSSTGAKSAVVNSYSSSAPSAADLSTEMGSSRVPHALAKPGQVVDLSIRQLGNFEYDPEIGGGIPLDVQRMQGATIKLHGFMVPMDQAESISQFALVPSLFSCCVGAPPQIQHTIVVQCPKGKAVSYYPDEIVVQGTLDVKEKKDDGFIVSIFDMQASSVKPATK